ncbi:CBS domain-containing protein [Microvirga aerophila]|uniref:Inosine-5-monophosphate dehydrogenase n=1 Tax=Microvirga aerophila TaxID=670291 RepID=A0A512BZI7_9HYPH|nr:CBS domain-containing protein [Microvirga aerophila]GEO17372.1 inosine-5-monophosphate dehydrogenase [Microvirga aerophila]
MTIVRHILDEKGQLVWTIRPDDTVFAAIEEMARKDVGALVVVDNGDPVGIFTERQYARDVFLKGRSSPTTAVKDVMRTGFLSVTPERTVEECMAIMTAERVRHLPIMDDGSLVGLISIGDLVKSIIEDREFVIDQLTNYISGTR